MPWSAAAGKAERLPGGYRDGPGPGRNERKSDHVMVRVPQGLKFEKHLRLVFARHFHLSPKHYCTILTVLHEQES